MSGGAGEAPSNGSRPATGPMTLYDVLRVEIDCTTDELRAAYRQRARELHPDLGGVVDGGEAMARVNDAWRVLSDPGRRSTYDLSITTTTTRSGPTAASGSAMGATITVPQPAPQASRSRRQAWVAGVQAQILRLSRLAGRSATQTLLVKSNRAPRSAYETLVEGIVRSLIEDTEARVRAARAAGAAPLDLGVAATLVGLRSLADRLRREGSIEVSTDLLMTAELVDRMWDVLAHELPQQLTVALGGNPRVAASLR